MAINLQGVSPRDLGTREIGREIEKAIKTDGVEPKRQGPDFAEALAGAFTQAAANERSADNMSARFAAGDNSVGLHEVIINAEKASISLKYAVTLKNKVLEAYKELMNTPV